MASRKLHPLCLADYAAFRLAYARSGPPMGSFAKTHLTPRGLDVFNHLAAFAGGKAPRFRGLSRASVYFKWVTNRLTPREVAGLHAAADWLREQGYEVRVEESTSSMTKTALGSNRWNRAGELVARAKKVPPYRETFLKMVIDNPQHEGDR